MIESIHKPTWIVQAPTHWPLTRFRYFGNFIGGGTPSKVNTDYWEGGTIPWVSPKDMKSDTIFDTEDHINEIGLKNSPCQLVPPDALLMVVRSGILRNKLPVARNAVPVTLNQDMRALLPIASVSTRFLQYFVHGCEAELLSHWCKDGSTVESIEHDILAGTWLALPPISEQRRIAAYLDEQTEKIDRLMDMRRRQMALLKEQRSALIQQAVTRGLNPNVPMKDSGLPWLGEIPEHWEVKQLRRIIKPGTSITYGIVQAGPHIEGGIPYIRTSDMSGDALPLEGYLCTSPDIDRSYQRSKVRVNDVVVAIRATIGKALPVPPELDGANLTQGTAKISPGKSITAQFLLFVLRCESSRQQFASLAKGTTFLEITLDMLRRFTIPTPSLSEQSEIVTFINMETAKLDSLRDFYDRQLTLLTEYRAALIHECVTGQRLIPEAASL